MYVLALVSSMYSTYILVTFKISPKTSAPRHFYPLGNTLYHRGNFNGLESDFSTRHKIEDMKHKKRRFFTNSNFYYVRQKNNGELQILNGTELVENAALLIWICGGKEQILKELKGNHLLRYDTFRKLVLRRIEYRRRKNLPL